MRVVFDTNIFISAFVFPGSIAEKAILRVINGTDILILSKEIISETVSVLSGKFSQNREAFSHAALYLSDIGNIVYPEINLNILKDEPDNRILECAVCGQAEIIVTGDKKMLTLKEYKNIKIVTLKDYLKL